MKPASTKKSPSPSRATSAHVPLNLLVAFPFFKQKIIDFLREQDQHSPSSYRLIVDSGAFSAFNSGVPIELDDYCKFLDVLKESFLPFQAVQLDVIGDPKATWKNYQTMKRRGYDVLPVFTRGDTEDSLERMYEAHDYVLVGGMVGRRDNLGFLKWLMERVRGRRVHWLGVIHPDAIKAFKPTSVDSSSWMTTSAMGGNAVLYVGGGEMDHLKRSMFVQPPDSILRARIKRLGFDDEEINEFAKRESWRNTRPEGALGTAMIRLSVCSHIKRAVDIETHVGTQVYLACGSVQDIDFLYRCRQKLLERNII